MTHENPNTTPSNPEAEEPSVEVSLNTRDGLLEYYGNKMEQMHEIVVAMGKEGSAWDDPEGPFKSGHIAHQLFEKIENNADYEPSVIDTLVARYVNSEVARVRARASIDGDAIMQHYPDAPTEDDAILRYMNEASESVKPHNTKIANKLREAKKIKNGVIVDFEPKDIKRLNGKKQENNRIIGDAGKLRAFTEAGGLSLDIDEFMAKVEAHENGIIDDATFNRITADFEMNIKQAEGVARAYMLTAVAPNRDYLKTGFAALVPLDDKLDKEFKTAAEAQRNAVKAAENEDTEPDPDLQQVTVPTTPPVTTTTPSPRPVPAPRPHTTTQPRTAQPTPGGQTGQTPPPPPRPRQPAPSGGATPPGGTPAQPDQTDPTAQGGTTQTETRRTRNTGELDALALEAEREAAKSGYDAAMDRLAGLKAAQYAEPEQMEAAKELFEASSYRMMELDAQYGKALTNTELAPEKKSALINAYYMARQSELRKATVGKMAENHESGVAAFVARHKKGIKIGGFIFAGIMAATGNVPTAIFLAAATQGVTEGTANYDKKMKAFFAADNGAAGTASHVNGQDSLDVVKGFIGPFHEKTAAWTAYESQMKEFDEQFMNKHRTSRRNKALAARAVGAGWFTLIMLGGHLAVSSGGIGSGIADSVASLSHKPIPGI